MASSWKLAKQLVRKNCDGKRSAGSAKRCHCGPRAGLSVYV